MGLGSEQFSEAEDDRVLVELPGLKAPIGSLLMRRETRGRGEVSLDRSGHRPAHFAVRRDRQNLSGDAIFDGLPASRIN